MTNSQKTSTRNRFNKSLMKKFTNFAKVNIAMFCRLKAAAYKEKIRKSTRVVHSTSSFFSTILLPELVTS